MRISRDCASKWRVRYRERDELGLLGRPSVPRHKPTATPAETVARIETLRRTRKWSAARIAHELAADGISISVRTVSRHVAHLGLNRRKFLDPNGENNRQPRRIIARWPGHMVHVDIKKSRGSPTEAAGGSTVGAASRPRRPPAPRPPAPAPATCICIRRSTGSPASPTPRHSPTRKL